MEQWNIYLLRIVVKRCDKNLNEIGNTLRSLTILENQNFF